MKVFKVFFVKEGKGLTSTSANYLANVAKEELKGVESKLSNLTFLNKEVELISGEKKSLIIGNKYPENLMNLLEFRANIHAFIAWIREAIKAKDSLLRSVENTTLEEVCEKLGIECPESPKFPEEISNQDIISEMSIRERNEYLSLEAFAATFGEYIHPGGAIAKAREDVHFRTQIPTEVSGQGRDLLIYYYTPSVSVEEIDKEYMVLQDKYREYERRLNAIKSNIKQEVSKRNSQKRAEYLQKSKEYEEKMNVVRVKVSNYLDSQRESISKLKIAIPESLNSVYSYLETLGK